MKQAEKARQFAAMHIPGDPVILYNIWDAGSAKAIAGAGARAIATGSWSVAAAQGYPDREMIPLEKLLWIVERIIATVDLPVTVDFEGGYAEAPDAVAENVSKGMAAGAVGINFEDQVVKGSGFYSMDEQAKRIAAIRRVATAAGIPLFINARTDLFLAESDRSKHSRSVPEAIERAAAYAEAGASGFFIPGLLDPELIGRIVAAVKLPVNVMVQGEAPHRTALARLGVARISYGPGPFIEAMSSVAKRFREMETRKP